MKRGMLSFAISALSLFVAGGAMAQSYEKTTINCGSTACGGTNYGSQTQTVWTNGVKGTPVTTQGTVTTPFTGGVGKTTTYGSCSVSGCGIGNVIRPINNRSTFRQDIHASRTSTGTGSTGTSSTQTYPYTRTNTNTYGCTTTGCKTETTVKTCTAAGACTSNSTPGTCTAGSTGCSKGKTSTCTSGSCPTKTGNNTNTGNKSGNHYNRVNHQGNNGQHYANRSNGQHNYNGNNGNSYGGSYNRAGWNNNYGRSFGGGWAGGRPGGRFH